MQLYLAQIVIVFHYTMQQRQKEGDGIGKEKPAVTAKGKAPATDGKPKGKDKGVTTPAMQMHRRSTNYGDVMFSTRLPPLQIGTQTSSTTPTQGSSTTPNMQSGAGGKGENLDGYAAF